jgi:hypothetical protein
LIKDDQTGGAIIVNFAEGEQWNVINLDSKASFTFKVEAGGFINSDLVNGSLQYGKLIL